MTDPNTSSVISNGGIFWISLGSHERYLIPKLDRLLHELKEGGDDDNNAKINLTSFRITNTHDISNLTSNAPLQKLKEIFHVMSTLQLNCQLFIKMSLQTESFQSLLKDALLSNAFTKLTIKGDFWTVGMEYKTMEVITTSIGFLEEIEFIGMSMDIETTKLLKQCLSTTTKSNKKRRLDDDVVAAIVDDQTITPSASWAETSAAAATTSLKALSLFRIHFEEPSILFSRNHHRSSSHSIHWNDWH